MRISDWSSDVCSSDLLDQRRVEAHLLRRRPRHHADPGRMMRRVGIAAVDDADQRADELLEDAFAAFALADRVGDVLADRKSVVEGKSVSGRVSLGDRRILNKKQQEKE